MKMARLRVRIEQSQFQNEVRQYMLNTEIKSFLWS